MNYCHFRSQCARYLQAHMTMASELQTIVRCNAVVTTGEREAPSDSLCGDGEKRRMDMEEEDKSGNVIYRRGGNNFV